MARSGAILEEYLRGLPGLAVAPSQSPDVPRQLLEKIDFREAVPPGGLRDGLERGLGGFEKVRDLS
jgi:hypothetical protein